MCVCHVVSAVLFVCHVAPTMLCAFVLCVSAVLYPLCPGPPCLCLSCVSHSIMSPVFYPGVLCSPCCVPCVICPPYRVRRVVCFMSCESAVLYMFAVLCPLCYICTVMCVLWHVRHVIPCVIIVYPPCVPMCYSAPCCIHCVCHTMFCAGLMLCRAAHYHVQPSRKCMRRRKEKNAANDEGNPRPHPCLPDCRRPSIR